MHQFVLIYSKVRCCSFGSLAALLVFLICYPAFLAIMAFGALFFGRKIINIDCEFCPIERWPTPFGIRAWPLLLILSFAIITGIYLLQNYLLGLLFNKIFWIVLLVTGFIELAICLLAVLTKGKIYMLFRKWIRAKCPVIYFVDNRS